MAFDYLIVSDDDQIHPKQEHDELAALFNTTATASSEVAEQKRVLTAQRVKQRLGASSISFILCAICALLAVTCMSLALAVQSCSHRAAVHIDQMCPGQEVNSLVPQCTALLTSSDLTG